MSYLGTYQSCSDTWVYTCTGCGQEFQVSDPFTPLDGLGWCSAECDKTIEEGIARRSLSICPRCRCEIDPFEGFCDCDPPRHNLFCLQDRPA
jgi:hypothetical protein